MEFLHILSFSVYFTVDFSLYYIFAFPPHLNYTKHLFCIVAEGKINKLKSNKTR